MIRSTDSAAPGRRNNAAVAAREAPRTRRARRCGRALAVIGAAAAMLWLAGACDDAAGPSRAAARSQVLGTQVTRPTTTSTTTSTTTTTTAPARPRTPVPAAPVAPVSAATPTGVGATCADALEYLAAHQAPGFTDVCADGSAFGHLGVTCVHTAGMCPGTRFVHIACPAPFVYMNEAHNTWTLTGRRTGIDPYGQGTAAQRAACASHR
jgi:hypothetical protein